MDVLLEKLDAPISWEDARPLVKSVLLILLQSDRGAVSTQRTKLKVGPTESHPPEIRPATVKNIWELFRHLQAAKYCINSLQSTLRSNSPSRVNFTVSEEKNQLLDSVTSEVSALLESSLAKSKQLINGYFTKEEKLHIGSAVQYSSERIERATSPMQTKQDVPWNVSTKSTTKIEVAYSPAPFYLPAPKRASTQRSSTPTSRVTPPRINLARASSPSYAGDFARQRKELEQRIKGGKQAKSVSSLPANSVRSLSPKPGAQKPRDATRVRLIPSSTNPQMMSEQENCQEPGEAISTQINKEGDSLSSPRKVVSGFELPATAPPVPPSREPSEASPNFSSVHDMVDDASRLAGQFVHYTTEGLHPLRSQEYEKQAWLPDANLSSLTEEIHPERSGSGRYLVTQTNARKSSVGSTTHTALTDLTDVGVLDDWVEMGL